MRALRSVSVFLARFISRCAEDERRRGIDRPTRVARDVRAVCIFANLVTADDGKTTAPVALGRSLFVDYYRLVADNSCILIRDSSLVIYIVLARQHCVCVRARVRVW